MLCTFDFDVVTAVCQLLINGYVMLCYFSFLLYTKPPLKGTWQVLGKPFFSEITREKKTVVWQHL